MNSKAQKLITTIENLSNLKNSLNHLLNDCPRIGSTLYKDTLKQCKIHLAKYKRDLELLRKNCKHNFEYEGHGHVYDFYKCTECGESEDR
jgi:hypothetical protein